MQLAKTGNPSADHIDITMYDFILSAGGPLEKIKSPTCGGCHPGGGALEYDRNGNRYDEYQTNNPAISQTLNGDYYNARWHESGVVEADCFLCHLEGYDFITKVMKYKDRDSRVNIPSSKLGVDHFTASTMQQLSK